MPNKKSMLVHEDNPDHFHVKQENFIVEKMREVKDLSAGLNAEQLIFVKNLVNPDLTDTELKLFLALCNKVKLNPFNKEIIAVVYKGQNGRTVNTIVTRDGKRVVAEHTGGLESIETVAIYTKEIIIKTIVGEGKFEETKETHQVEPWEGGRLWGAICTVKRDGHQFTVRVPFSEYNTSRNVWSTKPETMIKKVAESQALSMAYPEVLGGVYDDSESFDGETKKEMLAGKITAALEKKNEEVKLINETADKAVKQMAKMMNEMPETIVEPKEEVVTARGD